MVCTKILSSATVFIIKAAVRNFYLFVALYVWKPGMAVSCGIIKKGLAADMHLHFQTCTVRLAFSDLHFQTPALPQVTSLAVFFVFYFIYFDESNVLSIFLIESLNILHK